MDAEVGGVVVEGGAGGAGVDGEADGAKDAVAGEGGTSRIEDSNV